MSTPHDRIAAVKITGFATIADKVLAAMCDDDSVSVAPITPVISEDHEEFQEHSS